MPLYVPPLSCVSGPHPHPISDVTDLQAALDGKAAGSHTHAIADVTSLQSSLDGKAASGHTHMKSQITDFAHTHPQADVTNLAADLAAKQAVSERAQANGYASLGADGKVPTAQLPASQGGFAWTYAARQAADVTHAQATFVNTDLVFTFEANSTYVIDLYLLCTSAAATTGYKFALDVSAAVTAVALTYNHQLANTGTLSGGQSIADANGTGASSGVPTAGALTPIFGGGVLVSGASTGTARLVFQPEVAASATFKAGAAMRVHKI